MVRREERQATPFPAHLRGASIDAWFDQRVRPIERFGDEARSYGGDCVFRAPQDVEARALFSVEYDRATRG